MERLKVKVRDSTALSESTRTSQNNTHRPQGELVHRRGEEWIEAIRECYPEKTPVFYMTDPVLMGILSHQTVNDILTLAKDAQIVPPPHQAMQDRSRLYYTGEEMVRAVSHWQELWGEVGGRLDWKARKIRERLREEKKKRDPRDLSTLTRFSLRRNRGLFSTISEVARDAGLYFWHKDVGEMAKILEGEGVEVAKISYGERRTSWVVRKSDGRRVAEILRVRKGEVAKQRKRRFVQITGAEVERMPKLVDVLTCSEIYFKISRVLSRLGVKISTKMPVEFFLSQNCPVVVFKYTRSLGLFSSYYLPKDQMKIFRKFVKERKRELGI